ncbi:unnamed protein product [Prunus armeniaca]|uniref:TF-B3 domain-containing protein n=1 Tax=Prunus armeniaca TaxID=36596 RepID=A0A6J5VHA5_PRUAR|nr:unnamed protein product [Prunus armeniaca]
MLVMEYGDLMADKIFLEVPDGAVWPVKLTRPRNGEIWLQKGWPEFAKFYSLKHVSSTGDEAEGNSNPSSETEGQGNKHDRDLALRTFAKTELEDLAYSKALSFKSNNPFLCDENASIILINSPGKEP